MLGMGLMLSAQDTIKITRPELVFRHDTLVVRYDLHGCGGQLFRVWLNVTSSDGKKLTPLHVSGDLGVNVPCGSGKQIVWDLRADSLFIEDILEVKVVAETEITVEGAGEEMLPVLYSLLFPGSGLNFKYGNERPYWIMGVTGYLSAASSLWFHDLARKALEDATYESDPDKAAKYRQDHDSYKTWSTVSGAVAGVVWVGSLVWTALAPEKAAGKVAAGRKTKIQLGTTVFRENMTPGLTLRVEF